MTKQPQTIKDKAQGKADAAFKYLEENKISIVNDNQWPEYLHSFMFLDEDFLVNEDYQLHFFKKLAELFKEKDSNNHCGQQYWRLALIYLHRGGISDSIIYFEKAAKEDKDRGDTFSAAIGFLSVIKPLIYTFDKKKQEYLYAEKSQNICLYQSLKPEEKKVFAETLFNYHDNTVGGLYSRISDFDFISDSKRRETFKSLYSELTYLVSLSIKNKKEKIGFGIVFISGALLEIMLEDLFTKENAKLWKFYRNDEDLYKKVGFCDGEISDNKYKNEYCYSLSLGQLLRIVTVLAKEKNTVPKITILLMSIIYEYRNLIHSNRLIKFDHKPNYLLAGAIYNSFSNIAHYWWELVVCKYNPSLEDFAKAVAYSDFLNKQGQTTIAVVEGKLDKNTEDVLKRFNINMYIDKKIDGRKQIQNFNTDDKNLTDIINGFKDKSIEPSKNVSILAYCATKEKDKQTRKTLEEDGGILNYLSGFHAFPPDLKN